MSFKPAGVLDQSKLHKVCCVPNILHILLTAQLATEKNLVPEGLLKLTKHIFNNPKVCLQSWQCNLSDASFPEKGAGKRQWLMKLSAMEGVSCLEYQHIFPVSLIVTVCAFIRFSVCFFSYRTRWLPCTMHWIMARLEVFVMCNSRHMRWTRLNSFTVSRWCILHMDGTTAGSYIYIQLEYGSIFSSCRLSGKWLSYLQHKN